MLDSIYVGMSGLTGYSQGLRVIAHNSANLNTPGFKSTSLQFADQFYTPRDAGRDIRLGHGLTTQATRLNFRQGELRQTGNELDLAVDGEGLFVLRDREGARHYSRAGQFKFDEQGTLVTTTGEAQVMAQGGDGGLSPVSLMGLRASAAIATKTITLSGNLSSTEHEVTVGGLDVVDSAGGRHSLSLRFAREEGAEEGHWNVSLHDGNDTVGSASIVFEDGRPSAGTARLSFTYAPAHLPSLPLAIDLGADVTSFASGALSSLAFLKQDGSPAGALTEVSFDASGTLVLGYSNGQTVKGPRLALARFDSLDAVQSAGDNTFAATDERAWIVGRPSDAGFGVLKSGTVEISNVDLSQEFSELVIMQRGYQASSQIVSTANEMIQELFGIRK